jgi:hypothetical protein
LHARLRDGIIRAMGRDRTQQTTPDRPRRRERRLAQAPADLVQIEARCLCSRRRVITPA